MNLSNAVRTAKSVITANSPTLLLAASITGAITTAVLAAKGGYKARGIIDDERMRRVASPEPPFDTYIEYKEEFEALMPELDFMDKAKLTWKCYASPALTGASTIASMVGLHAIHTKRQATMAGLYAVTSTKLEDYREKAEELLGAKKSKQVNDEVAQKQVDRNPVGDHEVVILEGGTELMYDEWTGRYMMGSIGIVEAAVANVNTLLAENGEASLNEFYDFVGLSGIPMGLEFGWNRSSGVSRLTTSFGSVKTKDGRAAISFWVDQPPKDAFGRS
jgi:hypothetical protein